MTNEIPQLNHIYTGDCLEIMRTWPDKCVDLVLTDPPYGINYLSDHYKNGNPFGTIIGDSDFPIIALQEMFRIAKRAVFCFCRWDNLKDLPKPKSFIAWIKNNWTAGDLEHEYGRQWEACAFYPQEEHQFISRPSDVLDFRRVPPSSMQHPTEKPVSVFTCLMEKNIGDIILDPFCGSGSSLVAAEKLGRKWIGIEIDPKYVAIADKRIAAEMAQGKLF
jgi:site-specific DNA-methyltransferase (adenine-specific)